MIFYRLLGEPVAERAGRELPIGPPQARRVFALLLLEALVRSRATGSSTSCGASIRRRRPGFRSRD
jgi:hypothetical protein